MKQTSVEWFMEQIGEKQPNGLYVIDTLEDVVNVFAKAKEMEKQQIDDAFEDGYQSGYKDNGISGEQYYNDTFREIEKL